MTAYNLSPGKSWVTGESVTATKMNTALTGSTTTITNNLIGQASSTTDNIPQWSDTTGALLKDGKIFTTDVDSGSLDTEVPSAKACYDGAVTIVNSTIASNIFESSAISLGVSGDDTNGLTVSQYSKAHGLGAKPKFIEAFLQCKSGNGIWSIGDRMRLNDACRDTLNPGRSASWVLSDATNVSWVFTQSTNVQFYGPLDLSGGIEALITDISLWEIVLTASL